MRVKSHTKRVLAALTHFPLNTAINLQQINEKASYQPEPIGVAGIRKVIERNRPDCVLIEGDSLTIFADPRNDEIGRDNTIPPPTCSTCYYKRSGTSPCPILENVNLQRAKAYQQAHPNQ